MKKIILSGHAEFATGMISAVNMIFGEQQHLSAVTFFQSEGIEDLITKFNELVRPDDEVLLLVDLFGGSPYNAAVQIAVENKNVQVVSGVSLPLVFEAIVNLETQSVEDTVYFLKKQHIETFKVFERCDINNEQNETLEDEL